MESNGVVNKIQCSQSTADLLIKAKKGHWLKARETKVEAKGKGLLQTYFVEPKSKQESVASGDLDVTSSAAAAMKVDRSEMTALARSTSILPITTATVDHKTERLVDWNADVLCRLLESIKARRVAISSNRDSGGENGDAGWNTPTKGMVLNEVREVIELPGFNSKCRVDENNVKLEPEIRELVKEYVMEIAKTYRSNNSFHNFDHASHVCMSVAKLLGRIVAADQIFEKNHGTGDDDALASALHDHTYGITSDPLTQFACVFAALIHDCDHPGLPNATLVAEGSKLAKMYDGKSVAEQHSVNLAWAILQGSKYSALRDAICETEQEVLRFRQLVVNSVMATDIMDKDLKNLRDARWAKAFAGTSSSTSLSELALEDDSVRINRKATIGTSILNFLRYSELQIISPSHMTISFFNLLL
jgi:3'5'-cyclic nucleotide phosphodiesterase